MVSVCAVDCELQGEVPPIPAQLLRSIPTGSYTALRAKGPTFKVYKQAASCSVHSPYQMAPSVTHCALFRLLAFTNTCND